MAPAQIMMRRWRIGSAPVGREPGNAEDSEESTPTQGTGPHPSQAWDAPRPRGASPPAAPPRRLLDPPHSGPASCEDLRALVTPDSLNAIAGDHRAACLVDRLSCCRWTLPSQPPLTVDSAVVPPISCPAQAPPGRPQPA